MLSVKHLIDTYSLTADDITQILDTAASFESVNNRAIKKVPALRGRTIVNLFLEPSTRTKSSFELAEKRLSADSLSMGGSTSSVVKGESLADTIQTISAMNVDMFVCRAKLAGTPQRITENTDAVLNAGLRLSAQPDAPAETLQRMLDITRAEKHAVAPNCATCAMPCGNTKDYDLTRLRSAAPAVRQRKLRLLQAVFRLAAQHPDADVQLAIYRGLFAFSEDWDEELLDPVIAQTENLCRR